MGFDVVRYKPAPDPALKAFELLIELRGMIAEVRDPADRKFLLDCATHLSDSRSQIFQDVFVLHVVNRESPGFFVEFGLRMA
jgi:hypothetical protein